MEKRDEIIRLQQGIMQDLLTRNMRSVGADLWGKTPVAENKKEESKKENALPNAEQKEEM